MNEPSMFNSTCTPGLRQPFDIRDKKDLIYYHQISLKAGENAPRYTQLKAWNEKDRWANKY